MPAKPTMPPPRTLLWPAMNASNLLHEHESEPICRSVRHAAATPTRACPKGSSLVEQTHRDEGVNLSNNPEARSLRDSPPGPGYRTGDGGDLLHIRGRRWDRCTLGGAKS